MDQRLLESVGGVTGRGGRSALIGVLTVIDEEFREIKPLLGTTQNIRGSRYYVRPDRGQSTLKSNAGVAALIDAFRPAYILMVGVAGGVEGRDGTAVGDVVIPDFIDYYEMRKLVKGENLRRFEPYDHPSLWLRADIAQPIAREEDWRRLVDEERHPTKEGQPPKVIFGSLISGEKVLGDDDAAYQRHILHEYDKALAVDMESWGLASCVYSLRSHRHYNPQYLVIRGISDTIREPTPKKKAQQPQSTATKDAPNNPAKHLSNNEVRQLWKPYAAHVAGALAAAVVERILESTVEPSMPSQVHTEA
jgi:nucleoside phosphorylase